MLYNINSQIDNHFNLTIQQQRRSNKMNYEIRTNLNMAMNNYNKKNGNYFITIDGSVLNAILSNAYTTDAELADITISSLSTIKRSINKLCNFGFLRKHITPNNIKTLEVQEHALGNFILEWGAANHNV